MQEPINHTGAVGVYIQIRQEIDWRAFGDRPDFNPVFREQAGKQLHVRKDLLFEFQDALKKVRQIAFRNPQIAPCRRPVNHTRHLVTQDRISLPLLGPQ